MFFALVDLLRYNDELNNSFKTFDTYMQERERRFNGSARPASAAALSQPPAPPPMRQVSCHSLNVFRRDSL